MTKYRIVEKTNALNETTFHVERKRWFDWAEVTYAMSHEYSAPIYYERVEEAEAEIIRLLKLKSDKKLRKQISSRVIKEI
jgi:hypothetical protein